MLRDTFKSMGTVVSIQAHGVEHGRDETAVFAAAAAAARAEFEKLNAQYSLYRDDSELSRVAAGELKLTQASKELRDEYARALDWREKTDGAFTPHRPDGVIDLSGTIKALAIQRAHDALRQSGFDNISVNAGGDILVSGHAAAASPPDTRSTNAGWETGIVDPDDRGIVLTTVRLTDAFGALCTSGTAERGEHIWMRPHTDSVFVQASVIAPDVMTADVLATALISGGDTTLDLVTNRFEVAVLVVKKNGELLVNPRFRDVMVTNGK